MRGNSFLNDLRNNFTRQADSLNQLIIVNVLVPEVIPLERGDVVVFQDPGGWLGAIPTVEKSSFQEISDFVLGTFGITAPDSAEHLVKRVIGLPGDVVESREGDSRIWINGVALDEPYLAPGSVPSEMTFKVTVPENSYWVMGDNRQNSTDSRYHQDLPSGGFVNQEYVVGRAILVSWPVENWIFLENFSETFNPNEPIETSINPPLVEFVEGKLTLFSETL